MQLSEYLEKNKLSKRAFAIMAGISVEPITRVMKNIPVSEEVGQKLRKVLGDDSNIKTIKRGRKMGSTGSCWKVKRSKGEILAYRIWYRMARSCYDPLNKRYENYGAMGYKLCSKWSTFEGFLEDMGPAPEGMKGIYIYKGKKLFKKENCIYVDDGRHYRSKCPQIDDPRQMRFDEKGNIEN